MSVRVLMLELAPEPVDPLTAGDERLYIALDLKDPYSHLAVPVLTALAGAIEQPVCWLPINRPPVLSPDTVTGDGRGDEHKRHRFRYREQELRFYAQALQRPLDALYAQPETDLYHSVVLWVGANAPAQIHAVLETVFERYWRSALSAEDPDQWVSALNDSGIENDLGDRWASAAIDGSALSAAGRRAVAAQAEVLAGAGLFNAPALIFRGEVFYGRGHLPLLKERLAQPRAAS
ncbi:MAG: DsbA family protein [Pseudomonadota bacterium]